MPAKWHGDQFKKSYHNKAFSLLTNWCAFVEAEAVRLVPWDTGNLRSNIHYKVDASTLIGIVGTGVKKSVNYASYVEFGTWASRVPPFDTRKKGMKPRPYLRPALDALRRILR